MSAEPAVPGDGDESRMTPTMRRRFTVDEYYRMAETGILSPEDRVELIEGEVVEMIPIGSSHAGHVKCLVQLLSEAVGDNAIVGVQDPIRLGDHSEPEPDISLLEPRDDFYASAHPTADDVLLLIEVADTSLEYDRTVKIPLYAKHGVESVWLLNLEDEAVEVYEKPDEKGYQVSHTLRSDASVEHPELGLEFEARDLFIS